jgi:hypothetical protein
VIILLFIVSCLPAPVACEIKNPTFSTYSLMKFLFPHDQLFCLSSWWPEAKVNNAPLGALPGSIYSLYTLYLASPCWPGGFSLASLNWSVTHNYFHCLGLTITSLVLVLSASLIVLHILLPYKLKFLSINLLSNH